MQDRRTQQIAKDELIVESKEKKKSPSLPTKEKYRKMAMREIRAAFRHAILF
jgi:hypothetical protein